MYIILECIVKLDRLCYVSACMHRNYSSELNNASLNLVHLLYINIIKLNHALLSLGN